MISISVSPHCMVSGLLQRPAQAWACLVLAHGAGAGMAHPFMATAAAELADRGIATLRYQFPYMEQGSKRPDASALAQATVRAAVQNADRHCAGLPLFAGGKSFGGRMTSQAQAAAALPGVLGLVFLGFPLHPAGKPSAERAGHLFDVQVPMLFLQGDRDALAQPALLRGVIDGLGERATLCALSGADHSFHVPVRSGGTDAGIRTSMFDALATWMRRIAEA